jgi:hypothetical protein
MNVKTAIGSGRQPEFLLEFHRSAGDEIHHGRGRQSHEHRYIRATECLRDRPGIERGAEERPL